MTFMEGERDGLPATQPHYQAVQMTALHAAYGTLLAWWRVQHGGGGQEVDVSLQDVVAHEYFNFVYYGSYGEIAQRVGGLSAGRHRRVRDAQVIGRRAVLRRRPTGSAGRERRTTGAQTNGLPKPPPAAGSKPPLQGVAQQPRLL